MSWTYRAFGDDTPYTPEQKIRVYGTGRMDGLLDRYDLPGGVVGSLDDCYDWKSPIRTAEVVVWTDYGSVTQQFGLRPELILRECPASALRVLAPKSRETIHSFPQPHLLVCNLQEARDILGTDLLVYDTGIEQRHPLQKAAIYASLMHRLSGVQNTRWVIVTCGEHGAAVSDLSVPGNPEMYIRPIKASAVDTTGAGDAFLVGLLADVLRCSDRPVRFVSAPAYSAAMVAKAGTLPPSREAVLAVAGNKEFSSVSGVQAMARWWHNQGLTISAANGCFDLLHAGHLHLLNEAKKASDKLIVLVDTDESVRALKGEQRPVQALQERMRHLSSLDCVDAVVAFNGNAELRQCLAAIKASVLVKGDDYADKEIIGETLVGRVLLVPRIPCISTTEVVSRLSS